MTKEIARALGNIYNQMNELGQRIDQMSVALHQESTDKIEDLTPYTLTKTAYYGDTEVMFYDVPNGNMSVFVKDMEGNYPNFQTSKVGSIVTVSFDPVINNTEVTLSILKGE